MPGMSPHPQGGINTPMSVQPTTPSLVDQLDKNTPAPTPTDQHEMTNSNKCVPPESPYTQANLSSIEPPAQLLSTQSVLTPNPSSSSSNTNNNNNSSNINGNNSSGSGMTTNTNSGNLIGNDISSPLMKLEKIKLEETFIRNEHDPSSIPTTSTFNNVVHILKRPSLASKDYENLSEDYYNPKQLLYDYSSWEAWMNHPVKRFKPNNDKQASKKLRGKDLYADEIRNVETLQEQVLALPLNIMADAPTKAELCSSRMSDVESSMFDSSGNPLTTIKSEPMDDDVKAVQGNLYTIEGLAASYQDLDQIFDSDDNEDMVGYVIFFFWNDLICSIFQLQMHTPPASNKSPGTFDDNKRIIGGCNNTNTGSLGTPELSKMFPTPPSLEHHPNCSPYGSGIHDLLLTDITDGPKIKQEVYPNVGTPPPEPIDVSCVFYFV